MSQTKAIDANDAEKNGVDESRNKVMSIVPLINIKNSFKLYLYEKKWNLKWEFLLDAWNLGFAEETSRSKAFNTF